MIVGEILATLLICVVTLGIVAWVAGAIYFDVGNASRWGALLVLAWIAAVGVSYVFWQPLWQPFLCVLLFCGVFLRWWFSQTPSNDRAWDPNFEVLARFDLDGDVVTASNVRNTDYRTDVDFTPRYENRRLHMSRLVGVDAVITFWGSAWMCHPMLIFDFGSDGRICMSIEVRYRIGQKYSFFRSLYRQQEIMYVVSDERDSILKRTKYSPHQDVYLYRMFADPEEIKKVFLEYVMSTNDLAETPHWYHGLTSNCTTSIYRQRTRQVHWDWRWLINGSLDQMIYDHKRLDSTLPFDELKSRSRVNEIADRAPHDHFGDFLRRELEVYRKECVS